MAMKTTATKQPFYIPRELGKKWGVNRMTIIRAILNGKLRAVRLSNRGTYMIPASEVERLERGE